MPSSIWRPDSGSRLRHLALWAGLLAGPLLWLTLLETNYVLAYSACSGRQKWFLFATIAATLALAGAVAYAAWKSGPPQDLDASSPPWSPLTREVRARWMSIAGVAFTLWFLIVMLAMSVPPAVLGPCD